MEGSKCSPKTVSSASSDTRIKIMEAAEQLFADDGIEATPLRTIAVAAGQRNTNSVQYHFGDRLGLLRAIFEYREGQLDAMRGALLSEGREHHHLNDIRWLLRVCFYPNFRHMIDNGGVAYLKLHAQYLTNLRPRGVAHPVDYDCPSTIHFREGIARLERKLNFLRRDQFYMRLESVGAMFLSALIQHAGRPEPNGIDASLFENLLEMMAAAITVPPWDFVEIP